VADELDAEFDRLLNETDRLNAGNTKKEEAGPRAGTQIHPAHDPNHRGTARRPRGGIEAVADLEVGARAANPRRVEGFAVIRLIANIEACLRAHLPGPVRVEEVLGGLAFDVFAGGKYWGVIVRGDTELSAGQILEQYMRRPEAPSSIEYVWLINDKSRPSVSKWISPLLASTEQMSAVWQTGLAG